MTRFLDVVSLDDRDVAHDTLVELPSDLTLLHDGVPFAGFAWRARDFEGIRRLMRWPDGVRLAERDPDCMACIAIRGRKKE